MNRRDCGRERNEGMGLGKGMQGVGMMGSDCGEKDEGMGLGKRMRGWDWAKG